jgi:hypothetical protein
MATNLCLRCLKPLNPERKRLGLSRCMKCTPQIPVKGVNVQVHKTGGAIEIMQPEVFANFKRVTARHAKGTNGKAFQQGTTQAFVKDC